MLFKNKIQRLLAAIEAFSLTSSLQVCHNQVCRLKDIIFFKRCGVGHDKISQTFLFGDSSQYNAHGKEKFLLFLLLLFSPKDFFNIIEARRLFI